MTLSYYFNPETMSRPANNRGMTLLELMFACAIVAVMLTMTAVSMRPTIEQEGSRGLAHTLAADLRAARAEALRSGRPVAVCFASDNKTNSLSRSGYIKQGDQRGNIWRGFNYETEYDATIFIGKWGDAVRERFDMPVGWSLSTSRETALFFGADGKAYSEDIYALDGRYPLLVAQSMAGDFGGPGGSLSAVRHPHTVWVSQSGTIEIELHRVPVGELPPGGSQELTVASLRDEPRSLDNPPSIVSASFLPKPAEGLDVAGIGQNYVQIHPSQREGQQLEYGLATIEVKAEDLDGGPLRYTLKATANAGEGGNFSIADQEGDLSFVYDTALRRHVWKTTVSWRPPRLAPAGRTYNLSLTVHDPDANTAEVSTQADLLPAVTSLPAARIVVVTLDGRMFLTNLDGANEVLLTRDGKEFGPFFSQDGSIIFSFHDEPGSGARQLRGRPANGALSYLQLATFPNSTAKILFDPTYTFAAVIKPEVEYNFAWGDVTESTSTTTNEDGSTSTDTSYSFDQGGTPMMVSGVSILNLMANDPPIKLTDTGKNFYWAANARHTFFFPRGNSITDDHLSRIWTVLPETRPSDQRRLSLSGQLSTCHR